MRFAARPRCRGPLAAVFVQMELLVGIGPTTSSLPRTRSTSELQQHLYCCGLTLNPCQPELEMTPTHLFGWEVK